MSRPQKPRRISFNPKATYFKPRAIPLSALEEVSLNHDEMEAVRLCDWKGYTQEEAAKKMKVSQSTVGRILKSARGKIAESLVQGKAIKIQKRK